MRILLSLLVVLAAPLARGQGLLYDHLHQMLPATDDLGNAVVSGDLDGDQVPDLVILHPDPWWSMQSPPGIGQQLLLGNGRGRYRSAGFLPFSTKARRSSEAALGDVDGDGDLDVVLAVSDFRNGLYRNDGAAGFTNATNQTPFGLAATLAVVLGDVDGDSDLDVVFGNQRSGNWTSRTQLFTNDGAGNFTDVTQAQMPLDQDETTDLALGDVDGDLDLDLMIANTGSATNPLNGDPNRLYRNDGAGSFTDATFQIPLDADRTIAVDLGDVDGDLDLDALMGNADYQGTGGQDRLYRNDGAAGFVDVTAGQFPVNTGLSTADVVLIDLDGDGDRDAFLATPLSPGMPASDRVYRNDGNGVFTDVSATTLPAGAPGSVGAVALDADGDLDPDLVLVSRHRDRLLLNDGAGTFVEASRNPDPSPDPAKSIAIGDVDQDGTPDAMLVSFNTLDLLVNDGRGGLFDGGGLLPPSPSFCEDVVLGDVDGDGDLDAFLSRGGIFGAAVNILERNDGAAGFVNASAQVPPSVKDSHAAAMGDVDADGDPDLVIGNVQSLTRTPWQTDLWLNDGTGTFADASVQLPVGSSMTQDVVLADLDGDGDLDVFLANTAASVVYTNDGAGFFTDLAGAVPPLPGFQPMAAATGDVDGDQDPDLLLEEPNGAGLLLNQGEGTFVAAPGHLGGGAPGGTGVALGDTDLDGDLDAWLGASVLLHNDGTGAFTEDSAQVPRNAFQTDSIALADLDGDGDPDLLNGTSTGPTRTLWNLRRHLAWREFPRVGYPLILDLWGLPGGFWSLWASASLAPGAGFGGWWLARPWIPGGRGTFDAQGQATVSWIVPTRPEYVGLTLYWQAALLEPRPALTNVETTVFVGV